MALVLLLLVLLMVLLKGASCTLPADICTCQSLLSWQLLRKLAESWGGACSLSMRTLFEAGGAADAELDAWTCSELPPVGASRQHWATAAAWLDTPTDTEPYPGSRSAATNVLGQGGTGFVSASTRSLDMDWPMPFKTLAPPLLPIALLGCPMLLSTCDSSLWC